MTTYKRVCFTINNYSEQDVERLQQQTELYIYCIIGLEQAPTTGTPHLQGFINFQRNHRFNRIRSIIGENSHVEKAYGTDEQNKHYCSKSRILFEYGEPQQQGKRNDLDDVVEALKQNTSIMDINRRYTKTFIRYHRGIERSSQIMQWELGRNFKTKVYILFGETGTGKSYLARERCTGTRIYYKPAGKWWDGYTDQESVIIDDFYGSIDFDEMLRICDEYPHKVEVKGAYQEFMAKQIYITSNENPLNWWNINIQRFQCFARRVTQCIEMNKYITNLIKF